MCRISLLHLSKTQKAVNQFHAEQTVWILCQQYLFYLSAMMSSADPFPWATCTPAMIYLLWRQSFPAMMRKIWPGEFPLHLRLDRLHLWPCRPTHLWQLNKLNKWNKQMFFFVVVCFGFFLNGYTNAETGPGVMANHMVTSSPQLRAAGLAWEKAFQLALATDLKLLLFHLCNAEY